jgi:2-dehydro-3-deoxygluconokinase
MVCCFGELLLRLSPVLGQEWINDARMNVYIAGAELNVARALAAWGDNSRYITALPENYLSAEIVRSFPSLVDTSQILYKEGRLGVYYLPQGTDLKAAGVIYDRSQSSFSLIREGDIDWKNALEGADWLHYSAITPALDSRMPDVLQEAIAAAHQKALTVSIDLNYRAKLWQNGIDPKTVIPPLVENCQVLMGNIWAIGSLLGIVPDAYPTGPDQKDVCLAAADQCAGQVFKVYPSVQVVAFTFRFSNEDPIDYFATYHTRNASCVSQTYSGTGAKDKVGSGDCFMAGLIHGIRAKKSDQYIIDYAASAAFGKLFEEGDVTYQRIEQVEARMA